MNIFQDLIISTTLTLEFTLNSTDMLSILDLIHGINIDVQDPRINKRYTHPADPPKRNFIDLGIVAGSLFAILKGQGHSSSLHVPNVTLCVICFLVLTADKMSKMI